MTASGEATVVYDQGVLGWEYYGVQERTSRFKAERLSTTAIKEWVIRSGRSLRRLRPDKEGGLERQGVSWNEILRKWVSRRFICSMGQSRIAWCPGLGLVRWLSSRDELDLTKGVYMAFHMQHGVLSRSMVSGFSFDEVAILKG